MGRPIKKSFFANTNPGGVGGEGVATIVPLNSGTLYVSTATAVIAAPDLPGGITATASLTVNGGGVITGVTVINSGSGYLSAPALTVSPATTGTTATFTVTLTTERPNGIAVSAWTPTGSSAKSGDIQKQESSHRYRVITADGVGICRLVAAAPAVGQMTITATDSSGKTYYVTKLTAHKAVLTQYGTAGHEFASGSNIKWTLGAAVLNTSVTVSSN